MANTELLNKVLEHIKANPEQWNQGRWTKCFAGWTVRLGMPNVTESQVPAECDCCPAWPVLLDDAGAEIDDVASTALELLALNEAALELLAANEAHDLFDERSSLDDLERIVQELTSA